MTGLFPSGGEFPSQAEAGGAGRDDVMEEVSGASRRGAGQSRRGPGGGRGGGGGAGGGWSGAGGGGGGGGGGGPVLLWGGKAEFGEDACAFLQVADGLR